MNKLNKFSRAILAIAIMLCVALPTLAHDFEVGGIYYNYLDKTAKTVEVTYDSYSNEYTGSVTIPSSVTYSGTTYSVTSIGENAFYDCSGLTSITIPYSVTSIGNSAFSYCSGLTSITIPNSVTEISSRAFYGCTSLISITIPNSVTSIGSSAFSGCDGLTSITIPNSVTTIGDYAFYECSGLTSIVVKEGNPKYDSRDNCNAIVETSTNTLILGCKNSTIPNSVTSIGGSAFEDCTGLTSIIIPNSVTSIGDEAFSYCSGLTSITIPNSVTSIGKKAFICNNLRIVKSLSNTPQQCNDNAFGENPAALLMVPKGSMMSYTIADGWRHFTKIQEFEVDDAVKPVLTIAYPEGGVIKQKVDNGTILELQIVPSNGWKCNSVTFNGVDVTNNLDADGNYNTPSITADSQLSIVFVKDAVGVANTLIDNNIKVKVSGNIVTIIGADEFSNVEIYNTAGTTIYNGIEKTITLDENSVYILTIEGRTFKFAM